MIVDVQLPKLGMSTEEADVVAWLVKVGDLISVGTPLVEVETEKVSTEIEAEVSGTIVELLVAEGDTVLIGTILCRIEIGVR
jgi:pyruvate/2-oxoglutarate dehydrogenase complex dihydrolipoamide acyltransferase (E2) component